MSDTAWASDDVPKDLVDLLESWTYATETLDSPDGVHRHYESAHRTVAIVQAQEIMKLAAGWKSRGSCPRPGDTVIYRAEADWRPELGIREYPAIVLYPTNELTFHLDLLVLNGLDPIYDARWVPEGTEPGTWRRR